MERGGGRYRTSAQTAEVLGSSGSCVREELELHATGIFIADPHINENPRIRHDAAE